MVNRAVYDPIHRGAGLRLLRGDGDEKLNSFDHTRDIRLHLQVFLLVFHVVLVIGGLTPHDVIIDSIHGDLG